MAPKRQAAAAPAGSKKKANSARVADEQLLLPALFQLKIQADELIEEGDENKEDELLQLLARIGTAAQKLFDVFPETDDGYFNTDEMEEEDLEALKEKGLDKPTGPGPGSAKKRKVESEEPQDTVTCLEKASELYWSAMEPLLEAEMCFPVALILTGVAQVQTELGAIAVVEGDMEMAFKHIFEHEHDTHFLDMDGIQTFFSWGVKEIKEHGDVYSVWLRSMKDHMILLECAQEADFAKREHFVDTLNGRLEIQKAELPEVVKREGLSETLINKWKYVLAEATAIGLAVKFSFRKEAVEFKYRPEDEPAKHIPLPAGDELVKQARAAAEAAAEAIRASITAADMASPDAAKVKALKQSQFEKLVDLYSDYLTMFNEDDEERKAVETELEKATKEAEST